MKPRFVHFVKRNITLLEKALSEVDQPETHLVSQAQKNALAIFHRAATSVPAYKDFLRKHHMTLSRIKTYEYFSLIPVTTKENYLNQYDLKDLVWDGNLSQHMLINASSGTTGLPYFWPLAQKHVHEGAILKSLIYRQSFSMDTHRTLLIICFGMGTWIAGMYTLLTSLEVHQDGYPLTVITPGFNKEETLRILSLLGPQFEQTVIAGIPTFVKDVLEEWKHDRAYQKVSVIKLLFAGEGFSEAWRSYVLELVRSKNLLKDSVSILGSADAALMGFETPKSIAVRRYATADHAFCRALFQSERVPALSAYLPTLRFFECEKDELILTANRGVPLIRYNTHDQGGILLASSVDKLLKQYHIDVRSEFRRFHVTPSRDHFPYVHVFGRGKFTATIYAANIYPENMRDVLSNPSVRNLVTGRFTQETVYKKNQDHYLNLNVELAPKITANRHIAQKIEDVFVDTVQKVNSEFRRVYQEYGARARPTTTLYQYGDPRLFPRDTVKKSS